MAKSQRWIPTFEPVPSELSWDNFASLETAEKLVELLYNDGARAIVSQPFLSGNPAGWPNPTQRFIALKNGQLLCAGLLAAFWIRRPDDQSALIAARQQVSEAMEYGPSTDAEGGGAGSV